MIASLCCCCDIPITLLFRKVYSGLYRYGVQITFSYLSKSYQLWIDLPTIPYFNMRYDDTITFGDYLPNRSGDYWHIENGRNCGNTSGFIYISVSPSSWNDYKVLTDFTLPIEDCYYYKDLEVGVSGSYLHRLGYQVVDYKSLMIDFELQIKEKLIENFSELGVFCA